MSMTKSEMVRLGLSTETVNDERTEIAVDEKANTVRVSFVFPLSSFGDPSEFDGRWSLSKFVNLPGPVPQWHNNVGLSLIVKDGKPMMFAKVLMPEGWTPPNGTKVYVPKASPKAAETDKSKVF
tara:strand:- start:858 stop:1229 length:372 start_codon:yes stop_codon:yes gene_type:complete